MTPVCNMFLSFHQFIKTIFGIILSLLLINSPAFAWQTLTENIDLHCTQAKEKQLDCRYRLLGSESVADIKAGFDGSVLTITENTPYPTTDGTTAILFLIDTSDPNRQNAINKNIEHIGQLLQAIKPYHRIGLATFNKQLRIEAPIGSSKSRVLAASKTLRAVGMTTELYRSMLKSIQLLSGIDAKRKVIYLFSDGQAEDKAYFHQDVIRAARKAGVIINSIGYPRSIALSVALQTLRRLSEETGGVFIEADNSFNLPAAFLDSPFDNIDTGGRLTIDLGPVSATGSRKPEVELVFTTGTQDIVTRIPVSTPVRIQSPPPAAAAKPAPDSAITQTPPIQVIRTPAPQSQEMESWLWYGVPIALIILIILTLITLVLIYKKPAAKVQEKSFVPDNFKPYAYLITQDEKAKRYPIIRTTWRIGRSRDNEMVLEDNSVSRRHAEIQRYSNGKFVLFDLDSSNGVYVNEKKIKKQKLEENDIIEIGDVFLRFTQHPADYQLEEQTAMQRTKAPF